MRQVTKGTVSVIAGAVVVLLALGALPGLLKSGDPYYLTATPVDEGGTDTSEAGNLTTVNATALPADRFPYTSAALAEAADENGTAGRSSPYWRGPVGLKGAFTHSPSDERDALSRRVPGAVTGRDIYVSHGGSVYRLRIVEVGG
jgi:hypothetical protein